MLRPPTPRQRACRTRTRLERSDHDLNCEVWAKFLRKWWPKDYDDPPPPASPSMALTRQARLAVLERRAARGLALFHPHDAFNRRIDLGIEIIPEIEDNGHAGQEETLQVERGRAA